MTWRDFFWAAWDVCQTAIAGIVIFTITFLLPALLNDWVERAIT